MRTALFAPFPKSLTAALHADPASGAEDLSEEKLRPLLKAVDLEYLLEREGCLTDEINWEDELSLGEKQRLAIARLLYS